MVGRARVGMEASTKEVDLSAGDKAEIKLTITNGGYVVDAFDVSVRRLDPSWYTLTPERVSLFPHASTTVTLQIKPPAQLSALAGNYEFEVVATSRDSPTDSASIPMRVRLAAVGELALGIEPQRVVARRGTYSLLLTNNGNKERAVVLRPTDPDERLLFSFGAVQLSALSDVNEERRRKAMAARDADGQADVDVSVGSTTGELEFRSGKVDTEWTGPGAEAAQGHLDFTMPAGSQIEIPVTVQPKKRIWMGAREVSLLFEVAATPPGIEWEAKDVRRVAGELVYRPILALWAGLPMLLRRGLLIAIPLLLLGLILFQLGRSQDDAKRQQASAQATAAAQMTAQAIALQTQLAQGPAAQTAAARTALAGGAAGAKTATALANMARNPATQTAEANAVAGSATQTAQAGGVKIVNFAFGSGADGAPQVTWEVTATNKLKVTINGTPVPPTGSQPLDTSSNQSLVLVGSAENSVPVSKTLGTLLIQPPEVTSFAAEPAQTCPGCEVILTWNTMRAARVTVDGTPVTPTNKGSIKVKPAATTEYVLNAENALGKTERVITVSVAEGLPTPTVGP